MADDCSHLYPLKLFVLAFIPMSDVPVLQYIDNDELYFQVPPDMQDLPAVSPVVNDYLQALPLYGNDYSAITAPQWQLEYAFTGTQPVSLRY